MTTYGAHKLIADALDDVADRLAAVAADLRDLDEPEPDDRARATARERMRRYRARRSADGGDVLREPRNEPRNSYANVTRNSDADEPENSSNFGPRYADRPLGRSVGRNDGGPTEPRNSYANVTRNTRNDGVTDDVAVCVHCRRPSPCHCPDMETHRSPAVVLTDDEAEAGRLRIRELRDALHEQRRNA